MEGLRELVDIFLHLDQHLNAWAAQLGGWTYALLFAIVFAETGLVVTPFLPGDSLLFAVGALASQPGSPIQIAVVLVLLCAAAVLGDAVNYAIGRRLGPRVFQSETSWLFNREHLVRTQHFYEKHGGKTIILARFIPIVRTFAPFVAGIGHMTYPKFALYNVTGGVVWVILFLSAGYFFADLPVVEEQFHYVILAIIGISVLPVAFEWLKARRSRQPRLPEA